MNEKESLERAFEMNVLDKNGLKRYIRYLRNEIQDLQPEITTALETGDPKRKVSKKQQTQWKRQRDDAQKSKIDNE